MKTAHPIDRPPVPLPLANNCNTTTLLPYLQNMYEDYMDTDEISDGNLFDSNKVEYIVIWISSILKSSIFIGPYLYNVL